MMAMPDCAAARDFIPVSDSDLEQSLAARFEQQVQRYPDKLAIRTRSQSVSYSELNNAANRLAATLRCQSKDDEAPVAVFFDQGVSQITAILAVLKAGRIYVPLDPADPRERTDYMLKHSGAALVLTDGNDYLAASVRESQDCRVLNIVDLERLAQDERVTSVNPDNPA